MAMDSFEAAFMFDPPPQSTNKKKKRQKKQWATLDQAAAPAQDENPLDFLHSDPNKVDEQNRQDSVNDFFSSLAQMEPGTPNHSEEQQQPFDFDLGSAVPPKVVDDDASSSKESGKIELSQNKQTFMRLQLEKTNAKMKELEQQLNELRQKKAYYHKQLGMNLPEQNGTRRKRLLKPDIEQIDEGKFSKKRSVKKPSFANKARRKARYEQVDAIAFMKKGSSMLKYGRFGYPHFRHFELTKDCGAMVWYSESKKLAKSRIELNNVRMLQRGQKTPLFKKHVQPKLESCSFSLIYGENGNKTLDVITKNKQAYILWTTGLTKLIEYHNAIKRKVYEHNMENEKACIKPESVMVRVKKRNVEAMENRLAMQPSPPRDVVEKDLNITVKTYNRLRDISQEPRYCEMKGMEDVRKRLEELEVEIENIRRSFETKSLNVASHEIWRTSVEIKALDSKIHAIIKSRSGKMY